MKRSEMIAYVQSAEGVPDSMKAAAIVGITFMPKSELGRFSELADRGLALVKSGDYEGVINLLEEVEAPPDVMSVARMFIGSLTHAKANPDNAQV